MGGAFRWKLRDCPVRSSSEAWEIVEAYLDTLTYPGVPLSGTCIEDTDARTHAGIRIARNEHGVIEDVVRAEREEQVRRELERRRREGPRGR